MLIDVSVHFFQNIYWPTKGDNDDYYKPVEGKTFCSMLQSISEHLWTNDPTKNDFLAPAYDPGNHFGGSLSMWPERNVDGDSRTYLGFWGTENNLKGGCCHYTKNDGPGRYLVIEWW